MRAEPQNRRKSAQFNAGSNPGEFLWRHAARYVWKRWGRAGVVVLATLLLGTVAVGTRIWVSAADSDFETEPGEAAHPTANRPPRTQTPAVEIHSLRFLST